MSRHHKRALSLLALTLCLLAVALANSPYPPLWAARHTLEYRVLRRLWEIEGERPHGAALGTLRGVISDQNGAPVAGAWLLASTWDGVAYADRTDAGGRYELPQLPAGAYRPVVDAPGYEAQTLGARWGGVEVGEGAITDLVATLEPEAARRAPRFTRSDLGEATTSACEAPLARRATRRTLTTAFRFAPTSPTLLYAPEGVGEGERLPTLLSVYPGPVESYECVSVALAAAGYAVIAIGPAYTLDFEASVDELEALAALARDSALPGADSERVAALGGSYSALLVQRLAERQPTWLRAQVLLGPPSDLFEIRRRFEAGTLELPFGLDRVLVALGLPDRQPELYWRYSSAYHVTARTPPTLLFHSRQDELVPYQQSERLAQALEAAGVPQALVLFDGSTHYLLEESAQAVEIYDRTLGFLAERLAP